MRWTGSHKWAMMRNMVTSLINHERIMTTAARAKKLAPLADKMITHAKVNNLHHKRLAASIIREDAAVVKLFEILGPRYTERQGGYTRVVKIAKTRRGDSAEMAFIEFVDRDGELRAAKAPAPSSQLEREVA